MKLTNLMNQLMNYKTYVGLQRHYTVLSFYFLVILVTSTVGHVMNKKDGFTNGMIVGFVISLILWYQYGRKMV